MAFLANSTVLGTASWDLVIRAFLLPANNAGLRDTTCPVPPVGSVTHHTKEVLCVAWNADYTLMCSGACPPLRCGAGQVSWGSPLLSAAFFP